MGIADIKGDQAFDVFAEIMEPMINIAMDEEISELFKPMEVPEDADPQKLALERVRKYLPLLMKKHKDDLIVILANLEGQKPKEYAKNMTIPGVLSSVNGLIADPAFRSFLS